VSARTLLLVFPALLAPYAGGEPRSFTDTAGRRIVAELQSADEDNITIRRADGKKFTIPLGSLAENDRTYVHAWRSQQERNSTVDSTAAPAAVRREMIGAFCRSHHRQQVGNGECWTLAHEAFQASGTSRPGSDLRVWGRLLDLGKERLEAGDIVEFRHAEIPGYGITGEEHTAVVIRGGRRGKCTLAEQNWGGEKTVRHVSVDLSGLVAGQLMVYRPE
jgi:hypothetical protein